MTTIKQQKTWETVFFTAEEDGITATVELELNHSTEQWQICTSGQEMVSFERDSLQEGELKIKALNTAVNYVKKQFTENKKLTYLAIPYTWSPEESFIIANEVASDLMNKGKVVFSPISHSHPVDDYMSEELRTSQSFWLGQDLPILDKCDEMYIVLIGEDGQKLIEQSKGCQAEIKRAKENGMTINYYQYVRE